MNHATSLPDMAALQRAVNGPLRVGWLEDEPGYIGGAELTAQAFADAAPDDVQIIRLKPPSPLAVSLPFEWSQVDVFVVHNCVGYGASIIPALEAVPVVKYVHDVWPHADPVLRSWLLRHAHLMFTGPVHAERFPYPMPPGRVEQPVVVPPAMDVTPFRDANGWCERAGKERFPRALMLAHHGKGISNALDWSAEAGIDVDVYGVGTQNGPLAYDKVPKVMAAYEHFVHLPDQLEPFGRTVVEAFAAGCNVHVNANVGALWWLQNKPELLEPGAAEQVFWRGVKLAVGVSS